MLRCIVFTTRQLHKIVVQVPRWPLVLLPQPNPTSAPMSKQLGGHQSDTIAMLIVMLRMEYTTQPEQIDVAKIGVTLLYDTRECFVLSSHIRMEHIRMGYILRRIRIGYAKS